MKSIVLREITQCSLEQKKKVRDIRNQESVRQLMFTDHVVSLDEHFAWIDKLEKEKRQIVFVVLLNEQVLGVVSINSLDLSHKKSDWAFYLDDNSRGFLGAVLEFFIINYAFDVLGLEKLNCEVIETNPSVVKMHLKFGFLEEGFRRSNIVKNEKRIGVYLLGLTKADWYVKRDMLSVLYRSIFERFSVAVQT